MSSSRWGREGPPPEAYSRVTNPERFEPLIPVVLKIIDQLAETYDVERTEAYGLDPKLERHAELARPTIRLRPRSKHAAPIAVAFTSFPGVLIRFGEWYTEPFPSCGCDACDETADSEIESVTEMIHTVTRGGFREAIRAPLLPFWGNPWRAREFRSPGRGRFRSRSLSYTPLMRKGASREIDKTELGEWVSPRQRVKEIDWEPWPLRR